MIWVTLAGAALLQVSNPGETARHATAAYVACLAKAAKKIDDQIGDSRVMAAIEARAIAASMEASCQSQAWAYLAAVKADGKVGNVSPLAYGALRRDRRARGLTGPAVDFPGADRRQSPPS